jgi:hypothetical protein
MCILGICIKGARETVVVRDVEVEKVESVEEVESVEGESESLVEGVAVNVECKSDCRECCGCCVRSS